MRYAKWMALIAALATVLLSLGGSPATGAKGQILKRAAMGQLRASYISVKVRRHGRVVRVKRRMPAIAAGAHAPGRGATGPGFPSQRGPKVLLAPGTRPPGP